MRSSDTENVVITTGQLPITRGKTYILRLKSIYSDLFFDKYGFRPMVNIGRFGRSVKELACEKSELQIAALLISFFNWSGMEGNDQFEQDKLVRASHNFAWFCSTVNTYEIYMRNVFGLNLDDEEKVREFVGTHMNNIQK